MSIKNISLILIGSILMGIVGGFLARSIFVGIILPVLLIVFYVMWKYMKSEPQEGKKEGEILDGIQTVNPQNQPLQPVQNTQTPNDRV